MVSSLLLSAYQIIDISDSFIYEVDLYISKDNCINLENNHKYSCNKFIENIVEFQQWIGIDFKVFKFVTLLSAPLKWLERNAIQVEYETPKEKRKRKLLEKNGKI